MIADDALLDEVRQAAEAALEARASDDGVQAAAGQSLAAARAALDGGHSIAAIAAAETEGERAARERVGSQVLRSVERSAKKMRDAIEEYERTVVRASRLGLPARDIAAKAGVSHGTVAAVTRRHDQAQATPTEQATPEPVEPVNTAQPAPEPEAG